MNGEERRERVPSVIDIEWRSFSRKGAVLYRKTGSLLVLKEKKTTNRSESFSKRKKSTLTQSREIISDRNI